MFFVFCFFKQKTSYWMRISDWSSDVCSSDLGRRADVVALGPDGGVTLVEIKVSIADLRGDLKWPEYLDYCDRYFWAVPAGFRIGDLEQDCFLPARTRSEEHTSELQSLMRNSYAVFCLKKKK